MRILHVLDHSLPLQSGYTFRTRAIIAAQQARGWTVEAVTGARQGAADALCETVDGITFHRTAPPGRRAPVLHEITEVRALAARVTEVARQFRPDVIHAHSPVLDGLAGLIAARRVRVPLLYEIRAFWEDAAVGNGTGREGSLRYRATKALETWAVRRADAVAVICDGLRGDLVARGIPADKIMVSPNGVDLTLFGEPLPRDHALAAELGLADEVVGFVGSFYDYEGLDDLIAAMPALVARRPTAQLLLVGGGPMAEALRAQAAASPVADRIRFVGRVPHDAVDRYYSVVDVLAYPRRRMRLTELVTPLKPLEAMAQGKLVAASDVGGHRELIRDGETGTLFAPDEPDAVAAALADMLADRSDWEARRARARAFVETERNWSSNIRRYDAVYQRLAEAAPGNDMVANLPARNLLSTIILAVAVLAGVGVAAGIATAPGVLLDALVERSGVASLYPAALPVGVTTRTVLALLAGGLVGAIGFAASLTQRSAVRAVAPVDADSADSADADRVVAADGTAVPLLPPPVIRRADAHSDAPPRRPIRASSELGAPLPVAAEENARPITEPPTAPQLVAENVVSLGHVASSEPEDVMPVTPPPLAELPHDLDQPLAAFDPAAIPAQPLVPVRALPPLVRPVLLPEPEPEPASEPAVVSLPRTTPLAPVAQDEDDRDDESIGALLARLERGRLARRREAPSAAKPVPTDGAESLDATLSRLRQLAAR